MNQPDLGIGQVRIGVTISVPEPYHSSLVRARSSYGDPDAGTVPPHVTLLMPTAVNKTDLESLADHLAVVAAGHRIFQIRLSGSATFRPVSPVVFVQVGQGMADCEELATAIRRGPLDQELRFPYHPHVTVAQEVPDEVLDRALDELAEFEAEFRVAKFDAYLSTDDGDWMLWRSLPLG